MPQITQPIFSPSPVSFPYYSGTQRGFTCQFLVDDIADKDTNVVLTQEYSKMDAGPIQFDSRLVKGSIKVLHGSKTFSGSVTFKYLTLMDEGVYYCEVFVKSTFDNEFILTTTDAAMLVINNVTCKYTVINECYTIHVHVHVSTVNLSIVDTIGTAQSVLIKEVSSLQRYCIFV